MSLLEFDIPSFSPCDGVPPSLDDTKIVLVYPKPILISSIFNSGPFEGFGKSRSKTFQISPTMKLEMERIWYYDEPVEVAKLTSMSKDEAIQWLDIHDISYSSSELVDLTEEEAHIQLCNLTDEMFSEDLEENVFLISADGKYTLQDLARAIYHSMRACEEPVSDEICQITFDAKRGVLGHLPDEDF